MKIENTLALGAGGNRGIGAALVHALLAGGASKVYAAVRQEADHNASKAAAWSLTQSFEEVIFPDPMSRQLYAHRASDHKAVERQFATM